MNVTYEKKSAMTFIGYHTEICPEEAYRKCPEFWDREYAAKYELLWKWIAEDGTDSFKLTFDEIESIAGIPIDHSLLHYKKELLAYGFRVEKISMKEKTVAFIHDRMEKEVSP